MVLRGDVYFHTQSDEIVEKYKDLDTCDREEIHEKFVDLVGGVYRNSEEIEKLMYRPKELKKKKKKVSTRKKTLDLLQQGKNISEIAKIRELSEGTIVEHVSKLRITYPDLDINFLKPDDQ